MNQTYTFLPVPGLSDVVKITAGDDSNYAILSNGSLVVWGDNQDGQLGLGEYDITEYFSPQLVPDLYDVVGVLSGVNHAFVKLSELF